MVEGPLLLLILLASIILIVLMTAKFKIHPFISLLVTCYFLALSVRMPLADVGKTITEGFGGTLTSIGIVIILGAIIGTFLEKSGAALKMADLVVRVVGKRYPTLAMGIMGYIVSIPVFCDSGFVILNSLKKALRSRTAASGVAMTIALSTGLYATHTLTPPTPGPIAAASNLGIEHNLITVILIGLIVAAAASAAGLAYAIYIGKRIKSDEDTEETTESYDELLQKYGKLPSGLAAFSPIVVPIILMALGSIANLPAKPFGDGGIQTFLAFLGVPVNALFVGFLCSLALLPSFTEKTLTGWIEAALKNSASIIMITGAGGAFGLLLRTSPIGDYLGQTLSTWNLGIFLPFIIAAALKTAQGSSTVSIITTTSLLAPMLPSLGLDSEMAKVLVIMATGAGAMTVSHANDSYFWVVTQFSGIKMKDGFKTQTMATLIQGVTAILVTFGLSLFLI